MNPFTMAAIIAGCSRPLAAAPVFSNLLAKATTETTGAERLGTSGCRALNGAPEARPASKAAVEAAVYRSQELVVPLYRDRLAPADAGRWLSLVGALQAAYHNETPPSGLRSFLEAIDEQFVQLTAFRRALERLLSEDPQLSTVGRQGIAADRESLARHARNLVTIRFAAQSGELAGTRLERSPGDRRAGRHLLLDYLEEESAAREVFDRREAIWERAGDGHLEVTPFDGSRTDGLRIEISNCTRRSYSFDASAWVVRPDGDGWPRVYSEEPVVLDSMRSLAFTVGASEGERVLLAYHLDGVNGTAKDWLQADEDGSTTLHLGAFQ